MYRFALAAIVLIVCVAGWVLFKFATEDEAGVIDHSPILTSSQSHEPRRFEGTPGETSTPAAKNKAADNPGSTPAVETEKNGLRVTGVLVDENKRPIAGAYVRVRQSEAILFMSPFGKRDSRTGNDGRFTVTVRKHLARYFLLADSKHHQRVRTVFSFLDGESHDLGVIVAKRGAVVRGIVLGPDDVPVPGASVHVSQVERTASFAAVWSSGASGAEAIKSGMDGRFQVTGLRPGEARLRLRKSGYAPVDDLKVTIESSDEPAEITVVLEAGRTITIQSHGPEGESLAGAGVLVELQEGMSPSLMTRFAKEKPRTDDKGELTLDALPAGALKITVSKNGYMRSELKEVGDDQEHLIFALEKEAVIFGYLQEKGSGRALVPTKITPKIEMRGAGYHVPDVAMGKAAAELLGLDSAENLFVVHNFGGRSCSARIEVEGFGSLTVEANDLKPGEQRQVIAEVHEALDFSGVVTNNTGEPVPGADVRFSRLKELDLETMSEKERQRAEQRRARGQGPFAGHQRERSDEAGRFRFADVQPGAYQLAFRHDNYLDAVDTGITIEAGSSIDTYRFTLSTGAKLLGTVLNAEGEPYPGAQVRLREDGKRSPGERRSSYQTIAGSDGRYELGGIKPGTYVVNVGSPSERRRAFTTSSQSKRDRNAGQVVELASGQELELNLSAKRPARVFGVIRSGGLPVKGALVQETQGRIHARVYRGYEAESNDNGSYEITDVQPGEIQLTVRVAASPFMLTKTLQVSEGQQIQFDVALPGGGIAGTVVDAGGRPVAGARVSARTDQEDQESGMMKSMFGEASSLLKNLAKRSGEKQVESSAVSGKDGRFALRYIEPGEYIVVCTKKNFAEVRSAGVVVGEGQTRKGIDLVLEPPCELEISVMKSGAPVAFAIVVITPAKKGGQVMRRLVGKSGVLKMSDLPAGDYTVTCQAGADKEERRVTLANDAPKKLEFEL